MLHKSALKSQFDREAYERPKQNHKNRLQRGILDMCIKCSEIREQKVVLILKYLQNSSK